MNHRRATLFSLVAAALIIGCGATPLEPPLPDADLTPGEDAAVLIDTQTTTPEDVGSPAIVDGSSPALDAIAPSFDVGAPPRDVVIPSRDTDEGPFCPRTLCMTGWLCCESLQSCLPPGERCPDDPPPPIDAGPARDVPRVDAGPGACRSNDDCERGTYCNADTCGGAGSCVARPAGCTLEYAPVCGCDSVTYGNACAAASAGVRVASRGACAVSPGSCTSARQCAVGQECMFPAAGCSRQGVCRAAIACLRPETFCSCAGETYLSCRPDRPTTSVGACAAVDAGVPSCRSNDDCGRGAYCNADTCGGVGTCVARPEICTREYAPVCGCDGETYGNACTAASAGVRVASRGECAVVDAGTRRCNSARECGTGQECVFSAEACVRDGVCTAGIACFRPETFCSCAGETYLSCRPDRPTISRGACAAVDAGTIACRSNDDCGRGGYCAGDVCGTAGTCAERPAACIEVYSPVCGCDGRTYPNSCYAAANGARVRSRGVCPDRL